MARPEVAVGAVCVREAHLLLIQRAHPPGQGQWALPGGRVEQGETLATALIREVREETALAIDVGALCGVAERIGDNYHFVILDFWASVSATTPRAGDDAHDVLWADTEQLRQLPLVDGLYAWLDEHGVLAELR